MAPRGVEVRKTRDEAKELTKLVIRVDSLLRGTWYEGRLNFRETPGNGAAEAR